jgi:hypothetical protein
MKTLFKPVVLILMALTSFVSLADNNDNNSNYTAKAKTFRIGMYQTKGAAKMNIMLEKIIGKSVTITLKNEDGEILNTSTVRKNTESYHGKFDMSELGDGKYTFEISDGHETIRKTVVLDTSKPTTLTRTMDVNKYEC